MERYDINSIPKANTAEAGALRVANSVDEKNCGCVDAAITPSNLYNLLNCRKANTAYKGNEIVACPYHTEFLLKCVQAGTTSTGSLDTTSATLGKVYTDGGVKWEVIVLPVELGGTGAANSKGARRNLGFQTEIKEGNDLNALVLDRNYWCNSDALARSLLNSPTQYAFALEVFPWGNDNSCAQRLTEWESGKVFVRMYSHYENVWTKWREMAYMDKVSSLPSTKALDVSLVEAAEGAYYNAGSYTAPCDGWLAIYTHAKGFIAYDNVIHTGNATHTNIATITLFLPMAKGKTYFFKSTEEDVSRRDVKFYYAQSEV